MAKERKYPTLEEHLATIRAKVDAAGGEEAYLASLPPGEPDDIETLRSYLDRSSHGTQPGQAP